MIEHARRQPDQPPRGPPQQPPEEKPRPGGEQHVQRRLQVPRVALLRPDERAEQVARARQHALKRAVGFVQPRQSGGRLGERLLRELAARKLCRDYVMRAPKRRRDVAARADSLLVLLRERRLLLPLLVAVRTMMVSMTDSFGWVGRNNILLLLVCRSLLIFLFRLSLSVFLVF